MLESLGVIIRYGSSRFGQGKHICHFGQLDRRYLDNRIRSGGIGDGVFHVAFHHVTDGVVLGSNPACFADGCIVIVTGHVGLNVTLLVVVGSAGKSEVSTSVYHIEVERHVVLQVGFRLAGDFRRTYLRERFRPVRQPSGVKFRHHVRAFAAVILVDYFFQVFDVAFTVCRGQCAFGSSAFKQPASVGRKQRDIETGIGKLLLNLGIVSAVFFQRNIFPLSYIRAELVFALHHNDRASLRTLQVAHFLIQTFNVGFRTFQESRVIATYFHAGDILKPPRIASVFPFGTYIRTGTKYHHHAFFAGNTDILGKVLIARKIPFSGFCFMQIPKHVCSHRVQPHSFHHLQTMTPVLMRNTGVVHLSCMD